MKDIKCSRCKKKVEVSESWKFKLCPKCHEKNAVDSAKRKQIQKQNRDNKKLIEGLDLKKYPMIKNFAAFRRFYMAIWHKDECPRDEYLRFVEDIRNKESREKAKVESAVARREMREDKRIFVNEREFPLVSDLCVEIRRLIINKGKSKNPNDSFTINNHLVKCDSCARWRVYDKHYAELTPAREGDFSAFDEPISGANLYGSSGESEENYEDHAKRILRDSDMNPDFKRSSNSSEDILGVEGSKELEKSLFDDKKQVRDPKLDVKEVEK